MPMCRSGSRGEFCRESERTGGHSAALCAATAASRSSPTVALGPLRPGRRQRAPHGPAGKTRLPVLQGQPSNVHGPPGVVLHLFASFHMRGGSM
eukprot:gene7915-biopygen7588